MESPVDQIATERLPLNASNVVASRKDAEVYTTLVETVFRPLPTDPNDNAAEEATLLPTLLNRVSSAIWSQGPTKQLVNEIQTLRAQKVAASQLLDDIEQEADAIEQRLQEKTKLAKIQQNKPGMFAFPCVACSNCATYSDEVTLQTKRSRDVLELRPVLRHRLQECEEALTDRDSELRQLRHELNLLRCEQAVSTEQKDTLLEPSSTRKDSVLLQYASRFTIERNAQSQMQSTFFLWSKYTHQRILRNKMLKRTALALTSTSAHGMTVVFSNWRGLVQDRKQRERLLRESRCRVVSQSYAAKFLMQANDSTILRAILLEWWRRSKEAALQVRIAAAEAAREAAMRDSRSRDVPLPTQAVPHVENKACCILM
jgi:multidrug efflux pump subunit AcrA (membrane-fusion protein)